MGGHDLPGCCPPKTAVPIRLLPLLSLPWPGWPGPRGGRPGVAGRRCRLAVGLALLVGLSVTPGRAAARAPAALAQACDATAHFSVLRDAAGAALTRADTPANTPAPASARAVWLDRRTLQWPGVAADAGRFRLHHAALGGLLAAPGQPVVGADAALTLRPAAAPLAPAVAARFRHLGAGVRLVLAPAGISPARLRSLHRGELRLVLEDAAGRVLQSTGLQHPGALDDLYADAQAVPLGLHISAGRRPGGAHTRLALWAPTAQAVWLCRYRSASTPAHALHALRRDDTTGTWAAQLPGDLSGQYYTYLVDVWVHGHGLLRQRVTDPYSVSLGADSRRSWIGRLDSPALQPPGWATAPRPPALASATDAVIYELHVRDFSASDGALPAALRGKYAAFADPRSAGLRHLAALARAGLTDVHLLPVFDLASVPEQACSSPSVPAAAPDSPAQQAAVMAGAAGDCHNWGYDPLHFNAPEGSFASRADDGAVRIREFRQMVMALHAAGLRVGMDVVYNHSSASGQQAHSVLDRIVPGYYHRLDAQGVVERSTCCDNTATEHRMMARLMLDSVRLWARDYRIDAFRFDLMGHQPRAAMEELQALLQADAGRSIHLLGEGWNFGEVANGARFVQASQLSLNGSGIGTFNDRLRDALRGGGAGDGPDSIVLRQGWLNGLVGAPNEAVLAAGGPPPDAALAAADLVRLGLAGSQRSVRFITRSGDLLSGEQMRYGDQPAGYASQPAEVVNYSENHDNHTLWDVNAFKLPLATSAADRARVQVLGLALVALSQGVPYFHAGQDLLRSKSMDGNSYDSGDWFNALDWTATDNGFGRGLPPARDNAALHALAAPRLADARLKPAPADIAFTRDAFQDLLRIRAGSSLFRLRSADEVQRRLQFHNTGPAQNPAVIAAEYDGQGLAGAGFAKLLLLVNTAPTAQTLVPGAQAGRPWVLHPVLASPQAADRATLAQARFDVGSGSFTVPARSVLVYVQS